MAIMIPERPRQFDPSSLEGLMFDALALLSDEYYIFHSFRITNVRNNEFHESETDFVIYNRNLGVLCLEAKAGQVCYAQGEWLYGNGIPMRHDGPFNQASNNKYKLKRYIEDSSLRGILTHCKFLHAVWFPSLKDSQIREMHLPSEADKRLIMTREALRDPEKYLKDIFAIDVLVKGRPIKTKIQEFESKKLIREILCPEFQVFPSVSFELDLKKLAFHRLLKEQTAILNFLEEQRTAAINGAAGTGKTMIACEKARRHAVAGEKVLFLCFNSKLKEYLEHNYSHENIDYYTIAGYVCKLCNSSVVNYQQAKEKLDEMYISGNFEYQHIIIDEGQDFGMDKIEDADILDSLYILCREKENTTFYVFYDRLQLVQANAIPQFIEELDCRLMLYRNCRNTENIAITSLKPITDRKPKLFEGSVKGVLAKIHFCNDLQDVILKIDSTIANLNSDGLKDITILTCKTEGSSILSNITKDGLYRKKYHFTTCRKFKGLESDAVILVDVDANTFKGSNVMLYYVGSSRARLRLDIFTLMNDDECLNVLKNNLHYTEKIKKAKREFASALNAFGSVKD